MNITHGNILAVFFQATKLELIEGAEWYQRAREVAETLADCYQLSDGFRIAAGVLAALSPNNRWERNVKDAENLIKAYACGLDTDAIKVSTFSKNKAKAVSILNGERPLDVLGGNKVRAFYSCIIGEDDVCVDGHAYSIWLGQYVATTKTPSISNKLYGAIAADYREATAQINRILQQAGNPGYTAAQVQAITWVVWRNRISEASL